MIKSFLSLLDEMRLNKITIKDTCTRSVLSSNTFHYQFICMEALMDAAFPKVQSERFRAILIIHMFILS